METNGKLTLDWKPPIGKSRTGTLTAMVGEKSFTDRCDIQNAKKREKFCSDLVTRFPALDNEEYRNQLDEQLEKIASCQKHDVGVMGCVDEAVDPSELLAKMPDWARAEATSLLEDPNLMKRVINDVESLGVAGERELVSTSYLSGVSRLLNRPLSVIVQGHSSSGKSHVIERTGQLFPPEAVLLATQMTNQALFYMPPGSLRHRFVLAGERSRKSDDDAAEATRALREMISARKLSKLVTTKIEGQMESILIEQEGPIAYIESTTLTAIFDEDANRCLLLTTDERKEQTRRIVATLANEYAGNSAAGDIERIVARHHAAQRMLEQREVVIPYAKVLGELFDSDRVEVRRAFPQLMSMIQASALLHQRQRKIDSVGRFIAIDDDYQLARHLLAKPFRQPKLTTR